MNMKNKSIIKVTILAVSTLLAVTACGFKIGHSSETNSSNNPITTSQNTQTNTSSETPVSSQEVINSSEVTNSSSENIISSSETVSSAQQSSSKEQPSSSTQESSSQAPISSSEQPSSSEEPPVVLESISVISNKEEYELGDSLNLTVTAYYSDGTSEVLNEYEINGYDDQVSGSQTVTVSYLGKTATVEIYVKPMVILVNAFPSNKLEAFLDDNEITIDIPYPVGYDEWNDTVDVDLEKMPCFVASTSDAGTIGTDSIQDTYFALIDQDNTWTVAGDLNGYTAIKENIKVEFSTSQGVFSFYAHILDLTPNTSANFPSEQLQAFLTANSLGTAVPDAVSNHRWHYETSENTEVGPYFYTYTDDEGTVTFDAIEDTYKATLITNGWDIDDSDYSQKGYYAIKGDVEINFYTADGHFGFIAYEHIEEEQPFNEYGEWRIINNISSLEEGDRFVIADWKYGVVAGGLNAGYLAPIGTTISDGVISELSENATQLIAHKNGDYWRFTSGRNKLGASAVRTLEWNNGTTDWTVEIANNGEATITNAQSTYGTMAYYSTRTRFTTYTSSFNDSRVHPQIYKFVKLERVYPTAVTLDGEDIVGINRNIELTASFTPSNTNQKSLIWSSSNEDVATVNNGVVHGIAAGTVTIYATAKGANGEDIIGAKTIIVSADVKDSWTIMLYICGADLESQNGLASSDLDEIMSVAGQPDDINIIVETGGASAWTNSNIKANKLGRYHISNKKLIQDDSLTLANMGKTSTFTSFLNWGLENYPASKTGVILWNHGGALQGVCYDENYNDDSLLNSEVKSALTSVFQTQGLTDKLEFIGYDACLMAVQDVAEFNSQFFNYMVSSEESETGYGWAYHRWVDDLYAYASTETILTAIVDGFIAQCDIDYGGSANNDQTLSVLDLSKMSAYKSAFESMASAIKSTARNNMTNFRNLLKECKTYGDTYCDYNDYYAYVNYYGYPSSWFDTFSYYGQTYYLLHGYYLFGTFDIYDVLTHLENNSSYSSYKSKITDAKNAFLELVYHNKAGGAAGESHGLTLYTVMDSTYYSYPNAETNFTNWRSIFN